MDDLEDYEARQLENIKRNRAILNELGIAQQVQDIAGHQKSNRPSKKRKVDTQLQKPLPSRTSARIAAATSKPTYHEETPEKETREEIRSGPRRKGAPRKGPNNVEESQNTIETKHAVPLTNIDELKASWSSWISAAPPPTRDETGTFHFASHPEFTPNKSPEEVLREGCFGGSYFRPLFSKTLGISISNDWEELPESWTEGLDVSKYLTSSEYDPDCNKFKVACGQSIEEWEANGWINHNYDVRGWFQWYCRFFLGRRCDDDERQVSRWRKCVGITGRWRRTLLKKYVSAGVREVFDDGEDGEDTKEVSPVIHQTCHHWAFCVTQDVLDDYWSSGK